MSVFCERIADKIAVFASASGMSRTMAISTDEGTVRQTDWTPTGGTRVLDAFPAQAVVNRGDHPCGHKNSDKLAAV